MSGGRRDKIGKKGDLRQKKKRSPAIRWSFMNPERDSSIAFS